MRLVRLMQGILREPKKVKKGEGGGGGGGILLCSLNVRCSLNPSSLDSRCTVHVCSLNIFIKQTVTHLLLVYK